MDDGSGFGTARIQHLGIPVGGALDPISLRAANILVGNPPGNGALEVAYLGPTLEVEADEVRLSLVGTKAVIEILPDVRASSGERIGTLRSVRVRRGEALRIGALSDGSVLYIAVEGGFDIPPVLGSISTCVRGGFGGWQGRQLVAGDRLPLCRTLASEREELRLDGLDLAPPPRFRALPGPQSVLFSEQELAAFLQANIRSRRNRTAWACALKGIRSCITGARILCPTPWHLDQFRFRRADSRSSC
jgi:allophanate hydrolase subunit 2